MYSSFTAITFLKFFDVFADLITSTILHITCLFKVSNKQFEYTFYIKQAKGHITFGNYIVTTVKIL